MSVSLESDADYLANRTMKVSRVDGMTECWEWTRGLRDKRPGHRYGCVTRRGRRLRAHQFSFVTFHGPVPAGAIVCHKCNNTLCCNPEHLYAGTYQDNADDMKAHGVQRARAKRRSDCPSSKLSEFDVTQILELAQTTLSLKAIASRFGVRECTVSRIVRNENWVTDRTAPSFRGRGVYSGKTTLTQESAEALAKAIADGGNSREIAAAFGVSEGTVFNIRHKRHWSNRPGGDSAMSGEKGTS